MGVQNKTAFSRYGVATLNKSLGIGLFTASFSLRLSEGIFLRQTYLRHETFLWQLFGSINFLLGSGYFQSSFVAQKVSAAILTMGLISHIIFGADRSSVPT